MAPYKIDRRFRFGGRDGPKIGIISMSQSNISRYLNAKPKQDTTLPTQFPVTPTGNPQYEHSLTPLNVRKKINLDIIRVLGIRAGATGRFTELETKLVQLIERVIRKGHCPSSLFRHRGIHDVLLCLKKFFKQETVSLFLDDNQKNKATKVLVFSALYDQAKEAAIYNKKLKTRRTDLSQETNEQKRAALKEEIVQLREKKDRCLIIYQKVIFTDADALQTQRRKRSVALFGKPCTLDELLSFYKKGGKTKQPVGPPTDSFLASDIFNLDPLDNSDMTFTSSDISKEDIVDWTQIKDDEGK